MRISVIVFIVINVVVMTMPYWTAKLFNDKIRAGQIGNRRVEDSLRTWKLEGKEFKHIVCEKQNIRMEVDVVMSWHNSVQMDTTAAKFILTEVRNDTLFISFDEKKYAEIKTKLKGDLIEDGSVVQVAEVMANTNDDYVQPYDSYDIGYEIKVYAKEIHSLDLKNTTMSLAMDAEHKVVNDWFIKTDSSELEISYNEEVMDSLGNYVTQEYGFNHLLVIEKNNHSSVTWRNLLPRNLTMILKNDYFSFENYNAEVEYRPRVVMDNNSDIGVNLSMLDKIKITRK